MQNKHFFILIYIKKTKQKKTMDALFFAFSNVKQHFFSSFFYLLGMFFFFFFFFFFYKKRPYRVRSALHFVQFRKDFIFCEFSISHLEVAQTAKDFAGILLKKFCVNE